MVFPRATIGRGGAANHLTTKDAKNAKESEHETLDAIFLFCHVEVPQQSDRYIRECYANQQLSFASAFDLLNILRFPIGQFVKLDRRAFRAFRGGSLAVGLFSTL